VLSLWWGTIGATLSQRAVANLAALGSGSVPADLDPQRFEVHRSRVRDVEIAYLREGDGGFPLVLLHGWPETKRIWWRNIQPLAAAGFEVIVPDLRGFGDSGLAADDAYDVVTHAGDVHALVTEVLGHDRCVACGGDLGGVVCQDLALRYEGFVARQVLFNTIPPMLPREYQEAGIPPDIPRETRMAADYFVRQGTDADGLALELDTPEKRRRYVAEMYGPRFWAAPGAFTPADVEFHVEPFDDAGSFRASLAIYEYAMGSRRFEEPPRLRERSSVPTLAMYGPEDHVIPRTFPRQMEVAFTECIGPFTVEGAGHFLQWEQPEKLNQAIRYFCLADIA
jgi:pimeloyl-ACP methyl ester carboxylesterase